MHATLILTTLCAARAADETDSRIAAALHAAPEDRRAGAKVLGYDAKGAVVTLREGTNDLICLGDKPGDEGFSVACYHTSLEPYMQRGRELAAQGLEGQDRLKKRFEEGEAGGYALPVQGATLYVMSGSAYDAATNTIADAYLRWVVYIPGATPETTGLAMAPSGPGAPWIMFPGTPGAHIMINPPK